MKENINQQLFNYWNTVRGTRMAPQRFEIEPSQIAATLANTFILERTEDEDFLFRLAGTKICECFGFEFHMINMFDLWESDNDRQSLEHLLARVSNDGAVGMLGFEAVCPEGRKLDFEAVFLPMFHTEDRITRILGAMCPEQKPYWLGTTALRTLRLKTTSVIWPDGRPYALIERAGSVPSIFSGRCNGGHSEPRIVGDQHRRFRLYEGGLST